MMQPPSPTLLIAAANTYIGWNEDTEQQHFARRSALVERVLDEMHVTLTDDAPVPWHTAWVNHVGYWAHYDHFYGASSWPLPATASAEELAAFAKERGVLSDEPREGDLFLLWAPVKQQFVRTGIVLRLGDFVTSYRGTLYREIETIEANTNERRDEAGGMVLKQLRRLSSEMGDKFVRWSELDVRAERVAGFIKQGAEAVDRRERVIENVVEAVLEAMVDETPEEQAA
jgi:hypothetical protein